MAASSYLTAGRDGLRASDRVFLTMEGSLSVAEVRLLGAHVVSWKDDKGEELLFKSTKYVEGKELNHIKGGAAMCFPQFSNAGALETDGFARMRIWSVDSSLNPTNDPSVVNLALIPTEEDFKTWPHRIELRMRISLSAGKLTFSPHVYNADTKPDVRIEGFWGCDYLDNLKERERSTDIDDFITFENEIDREYLKTEGEIKFFDHQKMKTIKLNKLNMQDAAIWNPGDKGGSMMQSCSGCISFVYAVWDLDKADLPEFERMVCVASVSSVENATVLPPGEKWTAHQELSIVHSS